jgi:hypothetical protein
MHPEETESSDPYAAASNIDHQHAGVLAARGSGSLMDAKPPCARP